MRINFYLFKRS